MTVITPDSAWRDTGPCPADDWHRVLRPVFVSTERDAMYDVAGDLSLLCLGQMGPESNYGDSDIYDRTGNLLGLRPRPNDPRPVYQHPTKGPFLMFGSPEECVAEWRSRILDPTYKGGIYTPGTTTILEFVNVYAPAGDGDNDPVAYTNRIVADMNWWIGDEPMPDAPVVYDLARNADAEFWGLSPAERDRLLGKCIPNRNGQAAHVVVLHIQQGTTRNSIDWHANHVSASASVYANKDGSLVYAVREDDGPWTNGDVSHPTAKGKELIQRYGGDPNVVTLSIETEGWSGDPLPTAQFNAVVWQVQEWQARYAIPDADVVRHADFNSDPDPDETRTFCPGDQFYADVLAAIGGSPEPPAVTYPPGFDAAMSREVWGDKYKDYRYNESGVISTIWREHAILSPLVYHFKDTSDGREVFTFASGHNVGRLNSGESFRVLSTPK